MHTEQLPPHSALPMPLALVRVIGRHVLYLLTLRHDGRQLRSLRRHSLYLLCAMAITVRAATALLIADELLSAVLLTFMFCMLLTFLSMVNRNGMLLAAFALLTIVVEPVSTVFSLLSWELAAMLADTAMVAALGVFALRTVREWRAEP